jgi:hypothetical protein
VITDGREICPLVIGFTRFISERSSAVINNPCDDPIRYLLWMAGSGRV